MIRLSKLLELILKIVFVIGLCLVIAYFMGFQERNEPIYEYTINKDTNSAVSLKANDFYNNNFYSDYYVASAIDLVNTNFKYKFVGSKKADINYEYNITATLIGNFNDNEKTEEVWRQDFIIKDKKNKNTNKDFMIDENFKINFDDYYKLVKEYEKAYHIVIDAQLEVKLNVIYKINVAKNHSIKIKDNIELVIPINNTVAHIDKNHNKKVTKELLPKVENNINALYISGIVMMLISVFIYMIKIVLDKNNRNNDKYFKHFLYSNRDLIVTVKNKPNIDNLKIMHLDIIDDLIDIAEQNNSNIIYYANEKILYVIIGSYVYIYKY